MRYILSLLWVASTGLAFPANGLQHRDLNGTRFGNETRSHIHPQSHYTATPHSHALLPASTNTPVPGPRVDVEEKVEIVKEVITIYVDQNGNFLSENVVDEPPVLQLIPTVHWDVDTSSPEHIIPQPSSSLYYAENGTNDPNQKHQMGSINVTYVSPAVVLDHSDSLSVTYDPSKGLIVSFSTQYSLDLALSTWSPETGLLMITYTEGCGEYATGDFCYFNVETVSCTPDLVCVVSGASVPHSDAWASADFVWGTYYPSTPPPSSYGGGKGGKTGTSTGASSSGSPGSATSTSAAAASGTSTTESDEAVAPLCGPVDPIYGLPSASLGEFFDEALDDCFGYYQNVNDTTYATYLDTLDGSDDLEEDSEDVVDTTTDLEGDEYILNSTLIDSNSTSKRSVSLNKRIPFITTPVSKDLFAKNLAFQLPKNQKTVDTPFGPGVLIKAFGTKTTPNSKGSADLTFYCIDCGASGSLTISGKASWALIPGLTAAELVAEANLQVSFQIGVVANAVYSNKFDFKVADIALSPLNFGVVTIGPQINIGTDVEFKAQANGQLLAGAKFGFQNAKSVIDFKDKSKSKSSGWTPQFTPVLQASGNISLSAEIGFPIGLSCAVTIAKFGSLGAGIVERPAIEAKAEFSAELNGKTGSITTTDGCKGIATQITFKNFLFVALNAFKKKSQYDLMSPYSKVLDKGCIKLPGTSNAAPAAASSAPAVAPTTAAVVTPRSPFTRRQVSNDTLADITDSVDLTNLTDTTLILPDLSEASYNTTNGGTYLSLVDSTSTVILTSCSDGNLYFQTTDSNDTLSTDACSTLFQSVDDKVVSDGLGRILHYYPNTMSALGVSRLRLSDEYSIPLNSSYISLNPSSSSPDPEEPYYTATDPSGNTFYPVVCAYTNATMPDKIFLVQNVTSGIELLQSPDLEFIVTGGSVDACYYLPMIEEEDDSDDFDDDWSVNETDEGGDATFDDDFDGVDDAEV